MENSIRNEETVQWKDVKGFEGYYQVSNDGRVRSVDRTITRHYDSGKTTSFLCKGKMLVPVNKGTAVTLHKGSPAINTRVVRYASISDLVQEAFQLKMPMAEPKVVKPEQPKSMWSKLFQKKSTLKKEVVKSSKEYLSIDGLKVSKINESNGVSVYRDTFHRNIYVVKGNTVIMKFKGDISNG